MSAKGGTEGGNIGEECSRWKSRGECLKWGQDKSSVLGESPARGEGAASCWLRWAWGRWGGECLFSMFVQVIGARSAGTRRGAWSFFNEAKLLKSKISVSMKGFHGKSQKIQNFVLLFRHMRGFLSWLSWILMVLGDRQRAHRRWGVGAGRHTW